MRKLTTEEFIEKAKEVHGDKYNYSKAKYISSRLKLCIICPEHGEFWQKAVDHMRGVGCPKCGGTKKLTTEQFIEKSKKVHGDKYDYSKAIYVDAKTKVCIICPKHGEFWQLPILHMKGCGCPKCAGYCETTNDYIEKAKEVHGDKYDYSKVIYKNNKEKVTIICPIHGEFQQCASKHLIGQGCPKCGIEKRIKQQFINQEEFIEKSKKVHGDKYDYSKTQYKSMHEKVCIICPEHGEFWQLPYDHINEHGCPKCGQIISKGEYEIYNLLLNYFNENEIIRHDRNVLDGKEIDIYIPSKKIGIEYNGLKWHSEEFNKDWRYHLNKTELAIKKDIKLIQIFEDEYLYKPEIVKNKILHILDISSDSLRIMGRKCLIREINKNVCGIFLDKYHIQGYGKCSKAYGAYYNDELVGVMSFLFEKENCWTLVRFATNYDYICQGIGGKLFKYFVKEIHPKIVKTFADRRWTTNDKDNFYTKIGFRLDKILKPDYRYINSKQPKERIHKANLRKRSIHKKYGLPMSMTENNMTKEIGLVKIWDCGLYKYIWTDV